jgi:tRNA (mo5U34)-methyltransferase
MVYSLPLDPQKDYLLHYADGLEVEKIKAIRDERNACFGWKGTLPFYDIMDKAATLKAKHYDFSGDAPTIGLREELSDEQFEEFHSGLKDLMPWRKGPFKPFGINLDAEWRSERKWNRVNHFFDQIGFSLKGKRVADIGCNNGYYMFRMLKDDPELVIGFDPMLKYFFHLEF